MKDAVRTLSAVLVSALVLASCAAATPGYIPEGGKKSMLERAKTFESGNVAADGRYTPSAAERELTCGRLRGSMTIIITRLKEGSKPEPSATSAAAQSAVAGIRGRSIILAPTEETRRERARLDAYNALLVEKKCPAVDIEKDLVASTTAQPTVAAPTKPTAKKQ